MIHSATAAVVVVVHLMKSVRVLWRGWLVDPRLRTRTFANVSKNALRLKRVLFQWKLSLN